ncbi:hypothetical protein HETIRDRAFT_118997 [Heterobasidion irregulare TC 32-1]|uniref:Uncharacterized protein n=1 Tax=Heterobasidion irregulare (strain TC 32-1) TaxID=747525 RepID=W4JTK8_HETIT|nr:uncharacterized protein HETIRDRAFT_118997 [Heterobasidion irregulare TC 32-1]ETW76868.1 hypothetical protein HETIRDRAFT_118997 [Heterobasidion irregulare TC 32-1]
MTSVGFWGHNVNMLAEKVFSILMNSMLNEQPSSRFTWFNLVLRGCQNAQLFVDMTVIGQWYSTHVTEDKVPKKHLTIKFCDLEDNLKAAVSHSSPKGTTDMADTATFTLEGSGSDDNSDNSNDDMDGQQRGPPCQASTLNIVQEFAICEEAFIDLLSNTPRLTGAGASANWEASVPTWTDTPRPPDAFKQLQKSICTRQELNPEPLESSTS